NYSLSPNFKSIFKNTFSETNKKLKL
ncbi:MAG: hypothetical protein RL017_326, partial [Pseudomonadota bacterium]